MRILLVPVLSLFFSTLWLSPQAARAESPVKVAVAGPMVGTSFSVGIQFKVGVTAALETLEDGKLLGRTIEMATYDDNCLADIAEKVAANLVETPPDVVIGHSCSATTISSAPIYAASNVLQITPASTNPKVTEMGIDTIFRVIGRDDVQGALAAERIATEHGSKRIGILRFPSAYSKGLSELAIKGLADRGITPAKVIESEASSASYVPEIEAFREAGIEVVYLVGGGLDSGVFVRQVDQLDAPFQVISSDTLVSRIFRETAGSAGDGIPFTFTPEAAKFATSAKAVKAIEAQGLEPTGYTLLAYAAMEVWMEGVRRAGSFDAKEVAEAIRGEPMETILGTISFDDKGDVITEYPAFAWYTWKEGQRVPID